MAMSRQGKNSTRMAVSWVQIREKRSFVFRRPFFFGNWGFVCQGGSFVKIGSAFFPIFMNTPLIHKSSKNTLVVGGQERFYFLPACHVANVAEGKKSL